MLSRDHAVKPSLPSPSETYIHANGGHAGGNSSSHAQSARPRLTPSLLPVLASYIATLTPRRTIASAASPLPPRPGHKKKSSSRRLSSSSSVATASMSEEDHIQDEVLRHSLENPEEFWGHQAEHLDWHTKPSTVLLRSHKTLGGAGGVSHDTWEWFPDGEISTCYNCVDRHVLAGRGQEVAIYYDSPVTDTKERITYGQLLEDVEVLAGALREMGVGKGDVVMLYSKFAFPWPWVIYVCMCRLTHTLVQCP